MAHHQLERREIRAVVNASHDDADLPGVVTAIDAHARLGRLAPGVCGRFAWVIERRERTPEPVARSLLGLGSK